MTGAGRQTGRVIVLDGDSRAALTVARSLGAAGFSVGVAASRTDALAFASRYAHEVMMVPPPLVAPDAYAAVIEERVNAGGVLAVVPCSENSVAALGRSEARLRERAAYLLPPPSVMNRIEDEFELTSMLIDLDIPIPKQIVVPTNRRVPDIPFDFPVILKPKYKLTRLEHALTRIDSQVAHNLDELVNFVRDMPPSAFPCLVQAVLFGEVEEYVGFFREGRASRNSASGRFGSCRRRAACRRRWRRASPFRTWRRTREKSPASWRFPVP
ncbi:MAG: hypothetical protein M5R36_03455 [Deltaproteobacteria bacterium]|nr:hypothetical protein [Deltaproteobacteria bacterium]